MSVKGSQRDTDISLLLTEGSGRGLMKKNFGIGNPKAGFNHGLLIIGV
jgi:hypothetical protein